MRRLRAAISALLLVALPAILLAEGQDSGPESNAGPTVVVIGHGPERPSTQQPAPVVFVLPVFVPVFTPVPVSEPTRAISEVPHERPPEAPSTNGRFGRFMADPTRRFLNDGWITSTGDPAAQPARR
jgi:hypothetical protein